MSDMKSMCSKVGEGDAQSSAGDDARVRREVPSTLSVAAIAEVAALVGDPSRTNMLMALLEGFALTAKELADRAGVTPQTASGHIAKLRAAGLIQVELKGRTHFHRLGTSRIERLLEILAQVAADGPPHRVHAGQPCADAGIGLARICRGHLAGSLAVLLAQRLCDPDGRLNCAGRAALLAWGIAADVVEKAGGTADICLDWSEGLAHLGGAIGSVILERCLELGWVKRVRGTKALLVTGTGLRGFRADFNVDAPR